MEIQLFQLENLFASPNRFLFFDLRVQRSSLPEELDRIFVKAVPKSASDLLADLKAQNAPLEYPIVLVCDDGELSQRLARSLEESGYTNVYVIAGGVIGLLSEL